LWCVFRPSTGAMPVSMTATVTPLPVIPLDHAAWMPYPAVRENRDPRSWSAAQAPEASNALAASALLTSPQSESLTASPLGTLAAGTGFGAGAGFGSDASAGTAAPSPTATHASTVADIRPFHVMLLPA
jgi:hypothetical protein